MKNSVQHADKKKLLGIVAIAVAVITILYFTIAPITFVFTPKTPSRVESTPNFQLPVAPRSTTTPQFSTSSLNFRGPVTSPGYGVRGPTAPPPSAPTPSR